MLKRGKQMEQNAFDINTLQFDEKGLIPAVVQDIVSGKVLMLAFMNKEALQKTIETGKTHFYSRSRQKLWNKGETSGHFQTVQDVSYDCDSDALLVKVTQEGAACHTNHFSCFYRSIFNKAVSEEAKVSILREIYEVIQERKRELPENSYVAKKMNEGIDRILKKIGEEAGEVIIAAKNGDPSEIGFEMADLIFHMWMVLGFYDLSPDIIYDKLISRRK